VSRSPAAESERELAAFPAVLRDLLEAERAAGNAVTEIGCGFPAPPCGAWARLARPVTTRPRQSTDELVFRSRNWHAHSFEWSDGEGCFFLLEPPVPAPAQPGMDEIRAAQGVGAGLPLPAPPTPRLLAAGEYCIDVDYRGEMATYREAERLADVTCTWGPHPIIGRSSLTGWRHPLGRGAAPMRAEERRTVLNRIAEYLRQLNMGEVEIAD
jgi:hypothetical protein